ncbi:UNVERIFIED_CONTAM: hypothetical protein PYX00_003943 [Menopon gallinae]|uniref:Endonuclease/exonuclease/phosphatase domain-containing protein n=1 Tax=Menopon gallinae TaxID=328185 RepID=A0AAW2I3F7_9NEOP
MFQVSQVRGQGSEKEIKELYTWYGEGKCSNCIIKQTDARRKELKKEEFSPAEKQAAINGIRRSTYTAGTNADVVVIRERYLNNGSLPGLPLGYVTIRKDVCVLYKKSRVIFEPVTAEDYFIAGSIGNVFAVAVYLSPNEEITQKIITIQKTVQHVNKKGMIVIGDCNVRATTSPSSTRTGPTPCSDQQI